LLSTAINDSVVSKQIVQDAKSKKILVNAAVNLNYAIFYLSSVVKKGNLKIPSALMENHPHSKGVKEVLNETFPDESDDLLNKMQKHTQQNERRLYRKSKTA